MGKFIGAAQEGSDQGADILQPSGCEDPPPTLKPMHWAIFEDLVKAIRKESETTHSLPAPAFDRAAFVILARIGGPNHELLLRLPFPSECVVSLNLQDKTVANVPQSEYDAIGVVFITGSAGLFGINSETERGHALTVMFNMNTVPHVDRIPRDEFDDFLEWHDENSGDDIVEGSEDGGRFVE